MNILAAESRASLSKSNNIGMTISLLRHNFDNFIINQKPSMVKFFKIKLIILILNFIKIVKIY